MEEIELSIKKIEEEILLQEELLSQYDI